MSKTRSRTNELVEQLTTLLPLLDEIDSEDLEKKLKKIYDKYDTKEYLGDSAREYFRWNQYQGDIYTEILTAFDEYFGDAFYKEKNHIIGSKISAYCGISMSHIANNNLLNDFKKICIKILSGNQRLGSQFYKTLPPSLTRDNDIILAAINNNPETLNNIPSENFIALSKVNELDKHLLSLLKKSLSENLFEGSWLKSVSSIINEEKLKENLTAWDPIFKNAINQNGDNLGFIPSSLRDYEKCLLAIKNNPLALQYASDTLSQYDKLCDAAIHNNPMALQFIPRSWIQDNAKKYMKFASKAVENDGRALQYVVASGISKKNYKNFDFGNLCKLAIEQNPMALEFMIQGINQQLELDLALIKELCQQACSINGLALQYIINNNFIKEDSEFFLNLYKAAVNQNPMALKFVPEEIKVKNEEMCLNAVKKNFSAINHLPENIDKKIYIDKLAPVNTIIVMAENPDPETLDICHVYQSKHEGKGEKITMAESRDIDNILKNRTLDAQGVKLVIVGHYGSAATTIAELDDNKIASLAKEYNIKQINLFGCNTAHAARLAIEDEMKEKATAVGKYYAEELTKQDAKKQIPYLHTAHIKENEIDKLQPSLFTNISKKISEEGFKANEFTLQGVAGGLQVNILRTEFDVAEKHLYIKKSKHEELYTGSLTQSFFGRGKHSIDEKQKKEYYEKLAKSKEKPKNTEVKYIKLKMKQGPKP